jgi:hypothetical protein
MVKNVSTAMVINRLDVLVATATSYIPALVRLDAEHVIVRAEIVYMNAQRSII